MNLLEALFERGPRSSLVRAQIGFLGLVSGVAGYLATVYIGLATFSFGLMNFGLLQRAQRLLHVRLMLSAIAIDIAIVLALELSRSAVETVVSSPLSLLQQVHVSVSLLALLLYLPTLYFGLCLWRPKTSQMLGRELQSSSETLRQIGADHASLRRRHRLVALVAYALRLIGFVTMFSMLDRK